MFVDIENFKSVLAIENLLIPYKRGRLAPDKKSYLSKEPITPDVCFQVLKSTNAPRNIKDMLQCIADLPSSEQARFKDVVLATFTQREQPNKQPHNIVLLGKKLAAASGYEAELAEVQKPKDGYFLLSASYLDKSFVTFENSFSDVDFSVHDRVVFLSPEKIQFGYRVMFPKNIEISNSPDVSFYDEQETVGVNLEGVQSIRLKEGAKVVLKGAENLPPNFDFSYCSEVDLSYCDLSNQPNLAFKDGAKVNLSWTENLPPNLDFSHCSEVDLVECDLSSIEKLVFKNQEQMKESKAQIPDKWEGNLIFADEQPETSLNLAMTLKTKGGRS